LPARLSPNAITHAGHFLNFVGVAMLVGLWPHRGWPFIASALLIQLWTLCDNIDGAHARRTGQSSPFGEFLDHGLDILNVTYIGLATGVALGVAPGWWVALALLVPGAVAATYWEQAQTGVFRLGLLNQIESTLVLSMVLVASAVLGNDWTSRATFGGISLQIVFLAWTAGQIGVGAVRTMARVGRAYPQALASLFALLAFYAALVGAWRGAAVTTVGAVTIGVGANLFFCMRMMSLRLEGKKPRVEAEMVAAAVVLAACTFGRRTMHTSGLDALTNVTLTTASCAVFGARVLLDARDDVQRLGRKHEHEQAPRAAD
jgi:phosphatidylglycerophosphate synthase